MLQFSHFHMVFSGRHKKPLNTEGVIEGGFADRDSESEYSESEVETKTESEKEESGKQITGNSRQERHNAIVQDHIRRGRVSKWQSV